MSRTTIECTIKNGTEQRTHGNYIVFQDGMRVAAFALEADAQRFVEPMRFDPSQVEITLDVERQDLPVRGNAMASGDDAFDTQCENDIIARLEEGDVWAWCTVSVHATYEGVPEIQGSDDLGCCSYRDQEDFKTGGYWDDMRENATRELRERLEHVAAILCGQPINRKGCP